MIVDGHIHFETLDAYGKLMAEMQRSGFEQFNVLDVGRISGAADGQKLAHGLWLKQKHPDWVFLFGGLDYSGMFDHGRGEPDVPFVEQLRTLMELGCDGLKLLSGKPTARKAIDVPLDAEVYQPFLALLEETHFPVLWHVGDPPEFWNADAVPLWAKQNRWWYDETHPPKELIDREIASVFRQHPKLNLVLPHFFFLSDRLDEAARLLDQYPSFHLDTAPGVEMQHNFTANYDAARAFFIQYADRILMGTDIGMGNHFTGPGRGPMVRRWLESGDVFPVPEDPCMTPDERPDIRGLALPKAALAKVMGGNFHRWVGRERPRPLNGALVKQVLTDLAKQARGRGETDPTAERVLREMGS